MSTPAETMNTMMNIRNAQTQDNLDKSYTQLQLTIKVLKESLALKEKEVNER